MSASAEIRWLRAVESWPHARDRALALLPFYAGLRIGDVVTLDLDDVRLSACKGNLRVFGKGGKTREVPVHSALATLLQAWLDERAGWPGADRERALFLSRRGGRLTGGRHASPNCSGPAPGISAACGPLRRNRADGHRPAEQLARKPRYQVLTCSNVDCAGRVDTKDTAARRLRRCPAHATARDFPAHVARLCRPWVAHRGEIG